MKGINKKDTQIQGFDNLSSGRVAPNFEKVFSYHFAPITIEEIAEDIPIEQTMPFHRLLVQYNEFCEEHFEVMDILESQSKFRSFYDFVLANALAGNIIVKRMHINTFINKLTDLQTKYNQNLKSVDIYYDEIVEKVYHPQGLHKNDEKVRREMYMFMSAYTLMKQAFGDKKRESKVDGDMNDKYFTHLKSVMEIVLRELPGANINRVVIALLHDVVEDIPGYSFETLFTIYGDYIANGVDSLSKKDWHDYLSEEEEIEYSNSDVSVGKILKYKAKERRNQDYFGHLSELNDDYLAVKMADRIHNLRTMDNFSSKKIYYKLRETEKYFFHVAKERMPEAYFIMKNEVARLKKIAGSKEKK